MGKWQFTENEKKMPIPMKGQARKMGLQVVEYLLTCPE
jgi:hypothetical protein